MNRGFTLVEMLLAVLLVGVLTILSVLTFNAVSKAWQVSTDYMDKLQRTDFAFNQLISGLRSMYYPHDGQQSADYGFVLVNNGDGEDPDDSDIIEWSKTGSAIVGNKNSIADTVHRVQVMVLEEGNHDYKDPIEITGLYARMCPDFALRPKNYTEDFDFSFANDEIYQPILISDGIVGFDCKVLKSADDAEAETDDRKFEDEFSESNAVPYKVQLTFRLADPEGRGYRRNAAPLMRIIRIPIHEQSLDGAVTPSDTENGGSRTRGGKGRNAPPPPRGGANRGGASRGGTPGGGGASAGSGSGTGGAGGNPPGGGVPK